MDTLKIKYLGIPSVTMNNIQIEFPFSKAESIFYILTYEKVISREVLCSLLWGDMDEQLAKKNLRNAIYIIRKNTFDDIIISPKRFILKLNENYNIISDVEKINNFNPCNVDNIDEIEWILNTYNNSFLEDLKLKSPLEFANWIENRSININEVYMKKIKVLCDNLMNKEYYRLAEMCCRKLIELEEYDELGYANLMKIYYHQNKFEDAINTYNELVDKLYKDLSVKPSKDTEKIYEEIINNIKIKSKKRLFFFYGRENEKKIIYDNIYYFIGNKSFKSLLISGEDGIGKTVLLNEIRNDLETNILKIDINCYEYEHNFIFKFWDKAFQQISNILSNNSLNISIPRNLIDSISKIFPTLHIKFSDDLEDYFNTSKYNITEHAIFDLFNILTQKLKVIFIIDDLHFIDKGSLELLYKIILANKYKIMLIASIRDEEKYLNHKLFNSLKCNNAIDKIHLNRFNELETKKLVKTIMPQIGHEIDRIYSESEGNPLFITEIINSIKNGNKEYYMTKRIESLIEGRLIDISIQAKKVLSICSLFHGIFDIEMLVQITDINGLELIDIIEELLDKGILKEEVVRNESVGLGFSHRKIREYVYNNISNSKRMILHEKVGEYYERQLNKYNTRSLYSEIIYHFKLSNNKIKLFRYKIKWLEIILNARHEIFPVEEVKEAVNLFQNYIDEASLEKEFSEIKRLYEELICCHNDNLVEEEIIYLYLYGRYNKDKGNHEEGLSCLNKMISLSEKNQFFGHALNGYLQIIHYYVNINDLGLMCKAINKAENIAKFMKDECKKAIVLRFKGYSNILASKYKEGAYYLRKAIKIFDSSINREKYILNIVASLFYLGEGYRLQGVYQEALSYYNEAINLCDENEEFPAAALIFSKIGYVKYKQENIDEAQFYFLKSLKAYEKSIFVWGRTEVYYFLYRIYEQKNNKAKASIYLEQALKFINKDSNAEIKGYLDNVLDAREQ